MNLSEPAVLLAALFLLIAGFAAGLTLTQFRGRRTETPTCLADPEIRGDLDACRDLIDQFDRALDRHLEDVAEGGHDDGALTMLRVIDRAGISHNRLDDLVDTLAWLAVYDDLRGSGSHDPSRREEGFARLAARCSRTSAREHEPDAVVTE